MVSGWWDNDGRMMGQWWDNGGRMVGGWWSFINHPNRAAKTWQHCKKPISSIFQIMKPKTFYHILHLFRVIPCMTLMIVTISKIKLAEIQLASTIVEHLFSKHCLFICHFLY